MATKIPEKSRKQLAQESMNLVLERSGVTKKDLLDDAMRQFFATYYKTYLTPAEQRKYASVIMYE